MSADTGQKQSPSWFGSWLNWIIQKAEELIDTAPDLEIVLKKICPSTTMDWVQDAQSLGWSQQCGKEFLTNLENKHKHVTQPETIIASTIGPAAGIGVGLGLPFAFRWLRELSIFRWTTIS